MESVLKNEKVIEAVRLFPYLWQVNTKSYKDAVAKANKNSQVAGFGQTLALSRTFFSSSAFCFVETKQKKHCFLVFFIAGAIHLLFHLLLFFTNYARALRLIRIHVVQTLGTQNCERSSATPLRRTLTLRW